jgi:bifunctional non-homologous end joining protein LigD
MIFDLDPPGNDFNLVKNTAKYFKEFFKNELNLNAFLMTTGSRGLHVVLPLLRNESFEFVRIFAQDTAKVLAGRYTNKLTIEVRKNKRKGRIFLDTARNAYAQTAVPPYSVRPIVGAPVAVPIEWDELSNNKLNAQSYNIKNIFNRLGRKPDPWKDIKKRSNSLKVARKVLDEIINEELIS